MKNLILILLFFPVLCLSYTKVFQSQEIPYYQDSEIILISESGLELPNLSKLCQELKNKYPESGNYRCRSGEDLLRDTLNSIYFNWLALNLNSSVQAAWLEARNPKVIQNLQSIQESYLIHAHQSNGFLWLSLFHGGQKGPVALYKFNSLGVSQGLDQLINNIFRGSPRRILTPAEKLEAASRPDDYFRNQLPLDYYAGFSLGHTSADYFLLPDSWNTSARKNQVRNFRENSDSLSTWNWMEDESPLYTARLGISYARFIGATLVLKSSSHKVKYTRDSLTSPIQDWSYNRYEVGLNTFLGHPIFLNDWAEVSARVLLGFHYSLPVETFDYKGSLPAAAKNRFELENIYKGASAGIVLHSLFNERWGLYFETGIAGRGKTQDKDPSATEADTPQIIGGSTLDYFTSIGFEYNLRKLLD
jgi:hypothetical protein